LTTEIFTTSQTGFFDHPVNWSKQCASVHSSSERSLAGRHVLRTPRRFFFSTL